jgi:RNA polymerase sigma-70 factor (ECF subfamily)
LERSVGYSSHRGGRITRTPEVLDLVPDPPMAPERTTDGEDARLLDRLCRSDGDALAALYDRYGRLAYGLAYRVAQDATEAEDIVQEAFLALWRQAERYDGSRGSVRSYLLTIVHRRAIDAVRARGRRPVLGAAIESVAADTTDPVEVSAWAEERQLAAQAMRDLPPDQRQVIELTYFEGLTLADAAQQLDIPVGTAKSRVRLALERMRKVIGRTR